MVSFFLEVAYTSALSYRESIIYGLLIVSIREDRSYSNVYPIEASYSREVIPKGLLGLLLRLSLGFGGNAYEITTHEERLATQF